VPTTVVRSVAVFLITEFHATLYLQPLGLMLCPKMDKRMGRSQGRSTALSLLLRPRAADMLDRKRFATRDCPLWRKGESVQPFEKESCDGEHLVGVHAAGRSSDGTPQRLALIRGWLVYLLRRKG